MALAQTFSRLSCQIETHYRIRTVSSRACSVFPAACSQPASHSLVERRRRRAQGCVVAATEEQRSPLDAPQEWEVPQPSRRPDIFPEFEKMDKVFLPKPLPGDPEMPDEEDEESRKRTMPGDPDPERKGGEPPEPEEMPAPAPGKQTERPGTGTDIPNQNPE
mmetsp:Transcript_2268/g.3749  ORF Transcript_2268/g.3749 Transcript_2268/m.3749 type:complete len:162 (-) Transcript_2268:745-1230(-)